MTYPTTHMGVNEPHTQQTVDTYVAAGMQANINRVNCTKHIFLYLKHEASLSVWEMEIWLENSRNALHFSALGLREAAVPLDGQRGAAVRVPSVQEPWELRRECAM